MGEIAKYLHDYNVRAFENLEPPELTASVVGTSGTTEYKYKATFVTLVGETTPSIEITVSTGPDTLNAVNKVLLQVATVPEAARSVRFYKNNAGTYELLGSVDASVALMHDQGQTLDSMTNPPTMNDSGRPGIVAICPHPGKAAQRQSWMDLQSIVQGWVQDIGDSLHKNGDVVSGCAEQYVSGNRWRMTAGKVYLWGIHVPVEASEVELTGTGEEWIGLQITPEFSTSEDDLAQRPAADEGVPAQYAMDGPDWLRLELNWAVDQSDMIQVRKFIDGQPVTQTFSIERTELRRELARRTNDVSGSFMVRPFPVKIEAHKTDADLLIAKTGPGKAYPEGWEVELKAAQKLEVRRARDTEFVNGSTVDAFLATGGTVVSTNAENFDVDGLSIKLRVGNGNSHTVTFSGNGKTAAECATAINASVNAYPTAGQPDIVVCSGIAGLLQIQAANGKSLTIEAVASDAYTVLGISTGTYAVTGQRIYPMNEKYVKDVADMTYAVEIVESVTHDGVSHKDLLGNSNVFSIIGAASSEVDCHDGKFDWEFGVDFGREGNYADYTAFGGSEPTNGATVFYKYRYQYTAAKGTRTLVEVIDAEITKGAEDGQDIITVTGATSIKRVIDNSDVTGLSGNVSDVVEILRVNDSAGQGSSAYSSYSLAKNSDAIGHSDSAIDWSAAGAQGSPPAGQPTTGGTYYVSYRFWLHEVEGDFVSADSYDHYEQIETAPDQVTLLRDAIDFRTLGILPMNSDNPVFDFNYYLKRVDKISLNSDGTLFVTEGKPARGAQAPQDQTGAVLVATLVIFPYTYTTKDVWVVPTDTLRIPQIGLNELRMRIERLEYYEAINAVERSAVEDTAALDAFGIYTDAFVGQGYGDIGFDKNGVNFSAAIDMREQCIRLPVEEHGYEITIDEASSSNMKRVGKVVVFDYEETVYAEQLKATDRINVNPDEVFSWQGTLRIKPEQDYWNDTEQLPSVEVNFDGAFDALIENAVADQNRARQINWGSWELMWNESGHWAEDQLQSNTDQHWVDATDANRNRVNALRQRTGTITTLVPGRRVVDMGERVVDTTLVPFMRTKLESGADFTIECTAEGLEPGHDYACTIDRVEVDTTPIAPTVAGVSTYEGKTTVVADASGKATFSFVMPSGIPVGDRQVKVFRADDEEASWASAIFSGMGLKQTKQTTTVGMPTVTERVETVTEQEFHWGDPLAQTISVTRGLVYISSVEIAVAKKDPVIPMTVEIRETLNGYPTRKVLQTATLYPDDISVSDDGSVLTKFAFDNIVAYGPGEYAMVLIANTTGYEVYYAELGFFDLVTGDLVAAQPYGGVLFHSPNNSTWEPYTKRDLKFKLNTCNFQNDAQIVFNRLTGFEASHLVTMIHDFLPVGCRMNWSYSTDGSNWKPFLPGINWALNEVATQVDLLCDITASGGTFMLAEEFMGVIMLLHQLEANYIGRNRTFTGTLKPDKATIIVDLDTDGVNWNGVRTVVPYITINDGEDWIEVAPPSGYEPVGKDDPYYEYRFETPDQASITGATNATPIVITSAGHGFKDNSIVDITGVTGNTAANGTFKVASADADTFALYDPDTGAAIAGNGEYVSGGTIDFAEFEQCRARLFLKTTNKAVTPQATKLRTICS